MKCTPWNRSTKFIGNLLLFIAFFHGSSGLQKELTAQVNPGEKFCFYEEAKAEQVIDIEYQVIDGGHGDLDISFTLIDPVNLRLVEEYKKSDSIHRIKVQNSGPHEWCFDNTFSTFSHKTVFFEIIIEAEGEEDQDGWGSDMLEGLTVDEVVDVKIQDIQEILMRIHSNLNKVKHDLDIRRSTEARDRNMAEENNFRVGTWSFLQICLMLVVGGVQVFMLRNLFETDPRANVWRKVKIFN